MKVIDRYLESEKVRIMQDICPLEIPWLSGLLGDALKDMNCCEDCEKCWNYDLPELVKVENGGIYG